LEYRNGGNSQGERRELVKKTGAWPFVSHWVYRHPDGSLQHYESRGHRKNLPQAAISTTEVGRSLRLRHLWIPQQLNWWIGVLFALGASLFAVASVFFLSPALLAAWSLSPVLVNLTFFAGSIPFTTAAYLQLYQAANAGTPEAPAQSGSWFGWRPHDIGWLSCALQFAGTLLFNITTFDALLPELDWWQQDLVIWGPDLVGSILFLISGYLAFIETCDAHWAWQPAKVAWWIVMANLLGCVAFMVSAVLAFVPPVAPTSGVITVSNAFTLIGAMGFLVGSFLMLPEATNVERHAMS
jgi:hypothetical protein